MHQPVVDVVDGGDDQHQDAHQDLHQPVVDVVDGGDDQLQDAHQDQHQPVVDGVDGGDDQHQDERIQEKIQSSHDQQNDAKKLVLQNLEMNQNVPLRSKSPTVLLFLQILIILLQYAVRIPERWVELND